MSDVTFILLYVEDVARSADFYSRLLEKPVPESSANFALLPAAPGLMLGLWRRGEVEPAARAEPGGGEIAVKLADAAAVEAAHERWSAAGVRVAQPPTRMDFGFTFVGLDPDGHRIRAFTPA
jgi:predicted enzyme related to lactoylglutathione lyase